MKIKDREYIKENQAINNWEEIKTYYDNLIGRKVESFDEHKKWLKDRSELDAFVSENLAWRYIKFTCNTTDEKIKENYEYFINEIQPKIAPYEDKLNKKFINFPKLNEFKEASYKILIKSIKNEINLFRKENIPLFTEISKETNKFNTISSAMTIEHDGKEMTLQQASKFLEQTDRKLRKEIYEKIANRRAKNVEELDKIFSKLVKLRTKVAKNAGFENYRDYKFVSLNRFDYTIEDNLKFHESIREEVLPLLKIIHQKRKEKLRLDSLKPYDMGVDLYGKAPLKPFEGTEELIDNSITVFNKVGELGKYLKIMKEKSFLDLDSRKGKAPGGYNYPLSETGIPFIFMNSSGLLRDLVTMFHEGGHAVHSFLSRDLELVYFKDTPSEVAELASMSMELITFDYWDVFFQDKDELKRAKLTHLADLLGVLPWVAIIDKFQHWIYTNPEHTVKERDEKWTDIFDEFSSGIIDFSDYEEQKKKLWQKQMHLFEVPFYYIEYAISQLGAIAIWKNFIENKEKGLTAYLNALKLGYTKSIPEIYKTAGIKFDFSKKYIGQLSDFVKNEISKFES
ncbi:MAG: M3 family oligoendopeptidase [Bacteroidota bacterium]|nr:M3 family oligoendopeptidase [Bacteroidota bacterium]